MGYLSTGYHIERSRGSGVYRIISEVNKRALCQFEAVTVLRHGPQIVAACFAMYAEEQRERFMDAGGGA